MAPADEPTPEAGPPQLPQLSELIGGVRGVVDGGLPGVLFVGVYSLAGLRAALATAVATALVLLGERLARRRSTRQALSGFAGIALAVLVARATHSARGYFLPGMVMTGGYGLACLLSLAVRRPLLGVIAGAFDSRFVEWREPGRVRRAAVRSTVLWAAVFGLRVAVQTAFYLADLPTGLAAAKLVLGWPLTALAAWYTVAAFRRAAPASGGIGPPAPLPKPPTPDASAA